MTLYGGKNVTLFIGQGTASNPGIGVEVNAAEIGVIKYANNTNPADVTYALYAFGRASLVGIPGLTVSGSLQVLMNKTGRTINQTIHVDPNDANQTISVVYNSPKFVEMFSAGVDANGTPDPNSLLTIQASKVFTLAGAVQITENPTGTLSVDVPTATVSITIPDSSGNFPATPTLSVSGTARFTIGGGQGFQLQDLRVNGFSIFGVGATIASPAPAKLPPTADLASPTNGQSIDVATLNQQGYIQVVFNDPNNVGLNVASITGGTPKLLLLGAAVAGVQLNGPGVQVNPNDDTTYRFAFTGQFNANVADPTVQVQFLAGSFSDRQGDLNAAAVEQFTVVQGTPSGNPAPQVAATLASPHTGTTVDLATINNLGYIDVTFNVPTGGLLSPNGSEIELTGAGAANLLLDANGSPEAFVNGVATLVPPTQESPDTYRYFLTEKAGAPAGQTLVAGPVNVAFVPATHAATGRQTTPIAETFQVFTVSATNQDAGTSSNAIGLGPLSLQGPSLSLAKVGFSGGNLVLTVALGVNSASLSFGGSSQNQANGASGEQSSGISAVLTGLLAQFNIDVNIATLASAVTSGNGSAILGAFSVPGKFNLSVAGLVITVPNVLTATASGIQVTYDPAYDPSKNNGQPQQLVSIDSASLTFDRFGITGSISPATVNGKTIPGLVVYDNGFTLGQAELIYSPSNPSGSNTTSSNPGAPITLGSILQFNDLRIGVQDFSVTFGQAVNFNGSIFIATGGAVLFPGHSISATISSSAPKTGGLAPEAMRATLQFANNRVKAFLFSVDTLTVQISSFVTFTGKNLMLNTGAAANQPLLSVGSISATVNAGPLQLTGSAQDFQFLGDGTFVPGLNFGVVLGVGSATGDTFKWPTWLPIQISSIGIQWPNGIQNDPANFVLTLSASVTGLEGLKGLTFAGTIQGIQIDVGKLIAGQFPIVGLTSIGVSVSGNLFGGQIDAALIGGILKLSAAGQMIDPNDTTTPVAARVFFAGLSGGFSFAGLGGFQIQLALSQLGPLGITLSVSTPTGILLDPDTGLTINNFTAGVQFFTTLPSYTDPKQLANLSIATPTIVSPAVWLASVEAQVVKQYQAIQANPGISGFAAAFTSPMLITGSATIYSIYTSQQLFNGQVGIEISTDGKIFVEGILNFAANNLSISGKLYADLSHVASGSVVVLFLAKIPDQVNLLTLDGSIRMGFTNPSGQEVTFKTTPPVSTTPTATIAGPLPGKNVALGAIDGEGFVDVTFPTSPANDGSTGWSLIPASVTNLKPAISLSGLAAGSTLALDNSQPPTQVGSNPNTYRFWLTGVGNGDTSANVTFVANTVSYAKSGAAPTLNTYTNTINASAVAHESYVDVTFGPTVASSILTPINVGSLPTDAVQLQAPGSTIVLTGPMLVANAAGPLTAGETQTVRFFVPAGTPLAAGAYTVVIKAGLVTDSTSAHNAAASGTFSVVSVAAIVAGPFNTQAPAGVTPSSDVGALNSPTSTFLYNGVTYRYIDVNFTPAPGSNLDYASILASPVITLTVGITAANPNGTTITLVATPIPIQMTPDANSILSPTPVVAPGSDHGYDDATLAKDGVTEFRYLIQSTGFTYPVGVARVHFNASWKDSAGDSGQAGNADFLVQGPTAAVVGPAAGTGVDVSTLNQRQYLDVTFPAPPSGYEIDPASLADVSPEFTLGGAGVGTVKLDISQAAVLISGTTYRFWVTGTFAPSGGMTVTFLPGSWSLRPTAYTPSPASASVTLTAPSFLDVTFPNPPAGFAIDPNSIIGAASVPFSLGALAGAGTAGQSIALVPGQAPTQISNGNVFRYAVTESFTPTGTQTVAVNFHNNAWSFIDLNATAASQALTTVNPNGVVYVDVTFAPAFGQTIQASSINNGAITLTEAGATLTADAQSPMLLSGTTYRFFFDGQFVPGLVNVGIVASGWQDLDGVQGLASTVAFTVEGPTAVVSNPANGGTADITNVNQNKTIDVTFGPAVGGEFDPTSIVVGDITLSGPGADGATLSSPTLVSGTTYRFTLNGSFVAGSVQVNFAAGAWKDYGFVDVEIVVPDGASLVAGSVTPASITLVGVPNAQVVAGSTPVLLGASGNTTIYRFFTTGLFGGAIPTVNVPAGGYSFVDSTGTTQQAIAGAAVVVDASDPIGNQAATDTFTVAPFSATLAAIGPASVVTSDSLNNRGYLDVPITIPGYAIAVDPASIATLTPKFTVTVNNPSDGTLTLDTTQPPVLIGVVGGVATYRFWYTGTYHGGPGNLTIHAIGGSFNFLDAAGKPIPDFADESIVVGQSGPNLYVDVPFGTSGSLNGASITKNVITITGATIASVSQVGPAGTYRFLISGSGLASGQQVTVHFVAGSWTYADASNGSVQDPSVATSPSAMTTGGTYIDVTYPILNGVAIDPSTITGHEFTLSGAGAAGRQRGRDAAPDRPDRLPQHLPLLPHWGLRGGAGRRPVHRHLERQGRRPRHARRRAVPGDGPAGAAARGPAAVAVAGVLHRGDGRARARRPDGPGHAAAPPDHRRGDADDRRRAGLHARRLGERVGLPHRHDRLGRRPLHARRQRRLLGRPQALGRAEAGDRLRLPEAVRDHRHGLGPAPGQHDEPDADRHDLPAGHPGRPDRPDPGPGQRQDGGRPRRRTAGHGHGPHRRADEPERRLDRPVQRPRDRLQGGHAAGRHDAAGGVGVRPLGQQLLGGHRRRGRLPVLHPRCRRRFRRRGGAPGDRRRPADLQPGPAVVPGRDPGQPHGREPGRLGQHVVHDPGRHRHLDLQRRLPVLRAGEARPDRGLAGQARPDRRGSAPGDRPDGRHHGGVRGDDRRPDPGRGGRAEGPVLAGDGDRSVRPGRHPQRRVHRVVPADLQQHRVRVPLRHPERVRRPARPDRPDVDRRPRLGADGRQPVHRRDRLRRQHPADGPVRPGGRPLRLGQPLQERGWRDARLRRHGPGDGPRRGGRRDPVERHRWSDELHDRHGVERRQDVQGVPGPDGESDRDLDLPPAPDPGGVESLQRDHARRLVHDHRLGDAPRGRRRPPDGHSERAGVGQPQRQVPGRDVGPGQLHGGDRRHQRVLGERPVQPGDQREHPGRRPLGPDPPGGQRQRRESGGRRVHLRPDDAQSRDRQRPAADPFGPVPAGPPVPDRREPVHRRDHPGVERALDQRRVRPDDHDPGVLRQRQRAGEPGGAGQPHHQRLDVDHGRRAGDRPHRQPRRLVRRQRRPVVQRDGRVRPEHRQRGDERPGRDARAARLPADAQRHGQLRQLRDGDRVDHRRYPEQQLHARLRRDVLARRRPEPPGRRLRGDLQRRPSGDRAPARRLGEADRRAGHHDRRLRQPPAEHVERPPDDPRRDDDRSELVRPLAQRQGEHPRGVQLQHELPGPDRRQPERRGRPGEHGAVDLRGVRAVGRQLQRRDQLLRPGDPERLRLVRVGRPVRRLPYRRNHAGDARLRPLGYVLHRRLLPAGQRQGRLHVPHQRERSVDARLFGISLASVGISFDFSFDNRANGGGTTSVDVNVSITVRIHILFVTISKTANFDIGTVEIPQPYYLAGDQANGQTWTQSNNGTLYLNMGSRSGYRNIANGSPNESFTIAHVSGNASSGETIQVTAFGQQQTFTGVKKIVGVGSTNSTSVIVQPGVTVPVELTGGSGSGVNNTLNYGGSGFAYLNGGGGDSFIEVGPAAAGAVVNGGSGNAYIVDQSSARTFLAVGGANDQIFAGSGNDTILGDGSFGNDGLTYTGPAWTWNPNAVTSNANLAGTGNSEIKLGGGVDTVTVGNGNNSIEWPLQATTGTTVTAGTGGNTLIVDDTPNTDYVAVAHHGGNLGVATTTSTGAVLGSITATGITSLMLVGGAGSDHFTFGDLDGSGLTQVSIDSGQNIVATGQTQDVPDSADPTQIDVVPVVIVSPKSSPDTIDIQGTDDNATFLVLASSPVDGVMSSVSVLYDNGAGHLVTDFTITDTVRSRGDTLTIDGLGRNDTINASGLGAPPGTPASDYPDMIALVMNGGPGNDTLIASPYNDVLNVNDTDTNVVNTDTYIGGLGTYVLQHHGDANDVNIFEETQDLDFALFNDQLVIGQLLQDGTNLPFAAGEVFAPESSIIDAVSNTTDPNLNPPSRGSRFAAGAIVEKLKGLFQQVILTDATGQDVMLVNAPSNTITIGGVADVVAPWQGSAVPRNTNTTNAGAGVQHYIVNIPVANTGRVQVINTVSVVGQLVVYGTDQPDNLTLNASGSGSFRIGTVVDSGVSNTAVSFSGLVRTIVETQGGNDQILVNDTASPTIVNLGNGNDFLTVGTVPTIPDTGNRTLEFPNGVPVVDTANMTNGNSNDLFGVGGGGDNTFTVNHNSAMLYLNGGSGDNLFIIRTFLVLRQNAADPSQITNLTTLFGGPGNNRYEYLQNAPVVINGGSGYNTLVIVGTPLGDTFIVGSNYVAGAGRLVNFKNIQAIEIAGDGPAQVYVMATSPGMSVTVVGGATGSTVNVGGNPPPLVFTPPPYTYTPPPITVPLPPKLVVTPYPLDEVGYTFTVPFSDFLVGGIAADATALANSLATNYAASLGLLGTVTIQVGQMTIAGVSTQLVYSLSSLFQGIPPQVQVTIGTFRINFQVGQLEPQSKLVQPAPVTVTPAPFVFDVPPSLDVSQIKGRLIVENANVIVHDENGPATNGILQYRTLDRLAKVGEVQNGGVGTKPSYDLVAGQSDTFLSLEGFGLGISAAGQPVFPAGSVQYTPAVLQANGGMPPSYYGLEITGSSSLQILLPDNAGSLNRPENFTIAQVRLDPEPDAQPGQRQRHDQRRGRRGPHHDLRRPGPGPDQYRRRRSARPDPGRPDDRRHPSAVRGPVARAGQLVQPDHPQQPADRLHRHRPRTLRDEDLPPGRRLQRAGDDADRRADPAGESLRPAPGLSASCSTPTGRSSRTTSTSTARRNTPSSRPTPAGKLLWYDSQGNPTTDSTITGVPVIQVVSKTTPGALPVYLDAASNQVLTNTGTPAFVADFVNGVPLYLTAGGVQTTTNTGNPALIQVDRSVAIPWTTLQPVMVAATGSTTLFIDDSQDPNATIGTLKTTQLAVDQLLLSGSLGVTQVAGQTIIGQSTNHTGADAPQAKTYFGGEPVIDPYTLRPLTYTGGQPVFDLFTGQPLFDPFGNLLRHRPGDPMLHLKGDPVVQLDGAPQYFLGGEVVLDELGNPVTNATHLTGNPTLTFAEVNGVGTIARGAGSWFADGFAGGDKILVAGTGQNDGMYTVASINTSGTTLTLNLADPLTKTQVVGQGPITGVTIQTLFLEVGGQESIQDRRTTTYVVVSNTGSLVGIGSSYTPPTFIAPTSRVLSLASLPGFNFTLTAADLVAVTVYRGTDIANLPSNQFTVNDAAGTITLASGVSLVGIDRAEISIATPAVHVAGDPVLYYGDEPVMVGQPVVNGSGAVVQDQSGHVVLYTDATAGTNATQSFVFGSGNVGTFTLNRAPTAFVEVTLNGVSLGTGEYTVSGDMVTVHPSTTPAPAGVKVVISYDLDDQATSETFTFTAAPGGSQTFRLMHTPQPYVTATLAGVALSLSEFTVSGTTVTVTLPTSTNQGEQLVVTYREFATDHARGEPVFVMRGKAWVIPGYQNGDPVLSLGNAPVTYFGGEPAYFTTADPVQAATDFHDVTFAGDSGGMPGVIDFRGVGTVVIATGTGNDTFTVVGTGLDSAFSPIGVDPISLTLNTGSGVNQVAVRSVAGPTTIGLGAGDATVDVGSMAGLWSTNPRGGTLSFLNVNGSLTGIAAALSIVGGSGNDAVNVDDNGDPMPRNGFLDASSVTTTVTTTSTTTDVNGVTTYTVFTKAPTQTTTTTTTTNDATGVSSSTTVTTATSNAPTTLASAVLTRLGMAGSINSANIDALGVILGTGNDNFVIDQTATGSTSVEAWGGNDNIDVRAISGPTTVVGHSLLNIHPFGPLNALNIDGSPFVNSVTTAPGDDVINVGSNASLNPTNTGGVLSGIQSSLTIDGLGRVHGDTLHIDDSGDTLARSGVLTSTTLTGFGMATAGITYHDVESLLLGLGLHPNVLLIASTFGGSTTVNAGPSTNAINIQSTGGPLAINGGSGTNTIDVGTAFGPGVGYTGSAPDGALDQINSLLRIDGGSATSTVTLDDSGNTQNGVAVLTGSSLGGLDFHNNPVQTVTIAHASGGTFTLRIGAGGPMTPALPYAITSEALRTAILGLGLPDVTDVEVVRIGDTFTIGFIGNYLLPTHDLTLTANGSALVSDASGQTPTVTIAGNALDVVQTLTVNATAGSYPVLVGSNAPPVLLTPGETAAAFQAALIAAINASGQVPAGGPVNANDVQVVLVGTTYVVTYEGLLRGAEGSPFLLKVAPSSTVAATGSNSVQVGINAVGGTFRLTPVPGETTYNLPWNASAAAIASALNGLLGGNLIGVTQVGPIYTITGLPAGSAPGFAIDDSTLFNPLAVSASTTGIDYENVGTLNVLLPSTDVVFNVQGTTAVTNVFGYAGKKQFFVSSTADESLGTAESTEYLGGNLAGILGNLNLSAGAGRFKLMISNASSVSGIANGVITDMPTSPTALPGTEIEVRGLSPAPIDYQAASVANFADGITMWTGDGNQNLTVNGTFYRNATDLAGNPILDITTLDVGLGNHNVTVNLTAGQDGPFDLNTQGPVTQYPTLPETNVIDAHTSTLPLIIFGGQGTNTILGGQGGDVIFGSRGRVEYLNSQGQVVTELGNGGQGDFTDGIVRPPSIITSVDTKVGGNDTITGGGSDNIILGGPGANTITAGAANDIVLGHNGLILLTAGQATSLTTLDPTTGGNTTITGGVGNDIILGGNGANTITANGGNDVILGHNGQVLIANGQFTSITTSDPTVGGNDNITGGPGFDMILGGAGNNSITGGAGNAVILGGNGSITFTNGQPSFITTTDPTDPFNNTILGGTGDDIILGGPGSNSIRGLSGNDFIIGNDGQVFLTAGQVTKITTIDPGVGLGNTIGDGSGNDIVLGGNGPNTITLGTGNDVLIGGFGTVTYTGTQITSIASDATIAGKDNNLSTLDGNDVVLGGIGNNTIVVGNGTDVVIGHLGAVSLLNGLYTNIATIGPTIGGNDTITGGNGPEVVIGGAGRNTINVGTGNDIVIGSNGQVALTAGQATSVSTTSTSAGARATATRSPRASATTSSSAAQVPTRSWRATVTTRSSAGSGQSRSPRRPRRRAGRSALRRPAGPSRRS